MTSDIAPTLPPLRARAFGKSLLLQVTADAYLRDDSHWRLQSIYEPALAAQTIAQQGVALDIGAGFGCFALPFATAFANWTVWAFEPEPEAFAALCANIRTHGLTNVIAVNAAVIGANATDAEVISAALTQIAAAPAGDEAAQAALHALLPNPTFRRHTQMRGVIEALEPDNDDFAPLSLPSLTVDCLKGLQPGLIKLTAPMAEIGILDGLRDVALDNLIGESWTHLPSDLVYGHSAGLRQTWIPRAGDSLLRLRRARSLTGQRAGLDVVVAMYNSQGWIKDCVDGILAGASADMRVLVVDDGSTDGGGDVVRTQFAGNDQVVLLTKTNGGCASARNYGRMHSDASHIAFVDADDVPGPGMFAGLLDLARHTGAEAVQAGFDLLTVDAGGAPQYAPSPESRLHEIIHATRHNLGDTTCILAPSWVLIQGQPSIWRRVHRRDFLDNRDIWFPEHIRAFDDQIFQMLVLQHVENVPMLDGPTYHYRQHAQQDIRKNDARMFYSLEMYRLILKRGLKEGWQDFVPVLRSFVNTVNWTSAQLPLTLRPVFEKAAAELWVHAEHALGAQTFRDIPETQFEQADFAFHTKGFREKLKGLAPSYGSMYLDSIAMHADLVKLLAANGNGRL